MVRIELDLGELENYPTDRIAGIDEQLLEAVPGLAEHTCSYGYPGGFLQRVREGTWLGHVIEHVAIELQRECGSEVERGKTRSVKGRPGVYNVMFAYAHEEIGRLAGRLAVEAVAAMLPQHLRGVEGLGEICPRPQGEFELGTARTWLREVAKDIAFGPTTASLVREADRRNIPWYRIGDTSLVQLGQGRKQVRIRAAVTTRTSQIATEIAADKDLTRSILATAGLPVPEGGMAGTYDEALEIALELGYPVVVKPLDGNHGRGVTVGVESEKELRWAFDQAAEHSSSVIVEQHFRGADHRILVVDGQVAAVAERRPASVVGDGKRTIAELVAEVNADPARGDGHEAVLTKIALDECAEHFLQRSGLAFGSVPAMGQEVILQPTANLSTGGTAIDRTHQIHPENARIAERAALAIGLDIAGIDFITPNIAKPVSELGGGIIEINAGPGFRMHLRPSQGHPHNVARPVIEMLYPGREEGRIPVFAITGTNGKSTTARMLAHILQQTGATVGLTSTTGVYINGKRILKADASGPRSARMVLADPNVDIAVLETARGGILREGLGFDVCDVGAVLNIAADHLGLKGVETLEELADVKSVVVESVRSSGCSVLNADDPLTAAMADRAGGRLCYFSTATPSARPAFLRQHIADGKLAAVVEGCAPDGEIIIHDGAEEVFIAALAEIPATLEGRAEFNVANALAAAAMAYAQGVPVPAIQAGLKSFAATFELSPGRLNMIKAHDRTVVLDYAHNPHGLHALGRALSHLRATSRRSIGLIGVAGDRRDHDIREMGAVAARYFDDLVFKEDDDLRGRAPGSVAWLMREGALAERTPTARMTTVLREAEAVAHCLQRSGPGDLVVITGDDVETVWKQIEDWSRTPEPSEAERTLEPV